MRAVRTVVGSAFPHQVISAIFNFKPNHNFKPWSTPMKVGMPINGQNFDKLWRVLSSHSRVWAGDMTAFDSSQPPIVMRIVAEVRKKGFEEHRDHAKICQLIDLAYEQLLHHPMGFKNFGDIAGKDQGFTTGHSSTTPDNCLALVINYLFAWRVVTGLRAREFFNYNTLVNFGDDHLLGWEPVFGWTPEKAATAMTTLGTVMRNEAPGQDRLPTLSMKLKEGEDYRDLPLAFLSKQPLPLTPDITAELKRAGVTADLAWATCHTKKRLLGKIKGWQRDGRSNSIAEYDALLSYMSMCAHHKDIFDSLATMASKYYLLHRKEWRKSGMSSKRIHKPPTYNSVLRAWYGTPTAVEQLSDEYKDMIKTLDNDETFVLIENPDPFSLFVRWLSDCPTIISPRYANTSWVEWFQMRGNGFLNWPLTLVAYANGKVSDPSVARYLLEKTPYSFLRSSALVVDTRKHTYSSCLVRHYLFNVYSYVMGGNQKRRGVLSLFTFITLIDHAFGGFVFTLTGKVTDVLLDFDFHIIDTIIIYFLSFVHMEVELTPLVLSLHSPGVWFGRLIGWLISKVSPAGAVDTQPLVNAMVRLSHSPKHSFCLSAPTGVGKSTRLIDLLQRVTHNRVVVIVPRSQLAISVGTYMQSLFPASRIYISTEGYTVEPDYRIVYATGQSFLANASLRHPDNIFVLDEAHVYEPIYIVLRQYFKAHPDLRHVFSTATPLTTEYHPEMVEVPAQNRFSITRLEQTLDNMASYYKEVASFTNSRSVFEKVLIFAPSKKDLHIISTLINRDCSLISSGVAPDLSRSVFISTSVSDAGITLPDVSFVLSPDVDVTVSTTMTDRGVVARPSMFKLSSQTITQRAGRTGRTVDGLFLLFHITQVEFSDLAYTRYDFIENCKPAIAAALPYMPKNIKETFTSEEQALLPLLDNFSLCTILDIEGLLQDVRTSNKTAQQVLRETYAAAIHDPTIFSGSLQPKPEEEPLDALRELKRSTGKPIYDVEFDALTLKPIIEDTPPKPTAPNPRDVPKWNNVSGSGLLCGVRALCGALAPVLSQEFSVSFVNSFLKLAVDEFEASLDEGYVPNRYYTPLQIQLTARYYFNTIIEVLTSDGGKSCLPGQDDPRFAKASLRLQNGHYNYWGLPVEIPEVSDTLPQFARIRRIFDYRFENSWYVPEPTGDDIWNEEDPYVRFKFRNFIRTRPMYEDGALEFDAFRASLFTNKDKRLPTSLTKLVEQGIDLPQPSNMEFRKRFYIYFTLFMTASTGSGVPSLTDYTQEERFISYLSWSRSGYPTATRSYVEVCILRPKML